MFVFHPPEDKLCLLPTPSPQVTELTCETQRGETVKITVTLTSELFSGSPVCIQFFNVIFRK